MSGDKHSFLPKLSEARYGALLLAAVYVVHMRHFKPLLPLSHLSCHTSLAPSRHFTPYDPNNLPRNERNVPAS